MCEASVEVVPLHLFCSSVPDVREAPPSPTHASPKLGTPLSLGTLLSLGTPGGPGWVRAALEEDGPSGLCKTDPVFKPSMMNISNISNLRKNPLPLLI